MIEQFPSFYSVAFFGTVIVLAGLELVWPRRTGTADLTRRWTTNITLFAIALLLYRVIIPVSVLGIAQMAEARGVGLLHLVAAPLWLKVTAGVLVLDAWKYLEHRLMHGLPVLWRAHLIHHNDVDVDFTSAERHHPLEIVASGLALLAIVYLLALPPMAVAVYAVAAAVVGLWSHANVGLSDRLDRVLRWVLVTPNVHTVHHSALRAETDSNFGLVLTVWDRLCGTFRPPVPGAEGERVLGLEYYREAADARLDRVLGLPFRSPPTGQTAAGQAGQMPAGQTPAESPRRTPGAAAT